MFDIRPANFADAEFIAEQRYQMFLDAGQADAETMTGLRERFASWVRPRLEDGSYLGWIALADGEVAAGAGLWLMDFPPHWIDLEPVRAYLLNFYVEPAFRGRGLAGTLLKLALDEAERRGIKAVTLHASKFGKPIYERSGFKPTNEMMLQGLRER
jgi:GNAT superfamily N-acetyltransferase